MSSGSRFAKLLAASAAVVLLVAAAVWLESWLRAYDAGPAILLRPLRLRAFASIRMPRMEVAGAQQRALQIEALKALANLVEVDEATFRLLLRSHEKPTIVTGSTGFLWFKKRVYMTSYDGFVFLCRPDAERDFRAEAPEAVVVDAKSVHIPFL